MKKLTSTKDFSHSARESACQAFGFDFNTGELEIRVFSWGSLVEVFSGENAGKYDIYKDDGVFIFMEA